MTHNPSWQELGRDSAQRANERLRYDGERYRQQAANDTLVEIKDILKAMLDAHHDDTARYREQAAHNADIARNLVNTLNEREEEILRLKSEVFDLKERIRKYLQEVRKGD